MRPSCSPSIAESGALLSPPEFSVSKEDEEERKLGTQAVKSGMEQARALIEAAGGKPGKILSIIELAALRRRAGRHVDGSDEGLCRGASSSDHSGSDAPGKSDA